MRRARLYESSRKHTNDEVRVVVFTFLNTGQSLSMRFRIRCLNQFLTYRPVNLGRWREGSLHPARTKLSHPLRRNRFDLGTGNSIGCQWLRPRGSAGIDLRRRNWRRAAWTAVSLGAAWNRSLQCAETAQAFGHHSVHFTGGVNLGEFLDLREGMFRGEGGHEFVRRM